MTGTFASRSTPLSVAVERTAGSTATVLALGDLDLSTSALLEAEIDRIVGQRSISVIKLDLSGVDFMDSTGLRMLWCIRQKAQGTQTSLLLRDPSEPVMKVLQMTGMQRIFSVERTT